MLPGVETQGKEKVNMSGMTALKAPFPYFGGKSRVASLVWERFGDTKNYVEPFAGSLAVLLGRPYEPRIETINDKDAYVSNFWRALKYDPDGVAGHADWPVNEVDLIARYQWLITAGAERVEKLKADPDYYDVQTAGWWVWGISQWIGGGWLQSPTRPSRKLPRLASAGNGIHRSSARDLYGYLRALSHRLRRVRVACGDWSRVVVRSATYRNGLTGIFLDPPYSAEAGRDPKLYRVEDLEVAHQVRQWAVENGENPLMRIALCGYEGEHDMPSSWTCVAWKAGGGYGNISKTKDNVNRHRERIWFSPHCLL